MFWFQIRVLSLLSDLEEAVKDLYFIYKHAGEVRLLLCFLWMKNLCASLSFEILCGKRRKWRRGKHPVYFFLHVVCVKECWKCLLSHPYPNYWSNCSLKNKRPQVQLRARYSIVCFVLLSHNCKFIAYVIKYIIPLLHLELYKPGLCNSLCKELFHHGSMLENLTWSAVVELNIDDCCLY